jgi:Rab-GTPase-TBC domain
LQISKFMFEWRISKKKDTIRCQCLKSELLPNSCIFGQIWLSTCYDIEKNMRTLMKEYEDLVNQGFLNDLCSTEIANDLPRTFPNQKYFQSIEEEGCQKLERVLRALAAHDKELGYVSGMNLLAGTFLLHCEEHVAFWNIAGLFKKLFAREIFMSSSCLGVHAQIIEILLMSHYPIVYKALVSFITSGFHGFACKYEQIGKRRNLAPQSLSGLVHLSWVFGHSSRAYSKFFTWGLFSMKQQVFFSGLFRTGWIYFYQVVLSFCDQLKQIVPLYGPNAFHITVMWNSSNPQGAKIIPSEVKKTIDWSKIFEKCEKIKISQSFIDKMISQPKTAAQKLSPRFKKTLTPHKLAL